LADPQKKNTGSSLLKELGSELDADIVGVAALGDWKGTRLEENQAGGDSTAAAAAGEIGSGPGDGDLSGGSGPYLSGKSHRGGLGK